MEWGDPPCIIWGMVIPCLTRQTSPQWSGPSCRSSSFARRPRCSRRVRRAAGTPTGPAVKYGLYPVGDEVLMSIPAFEVIVHMLASGSPEERQELSAVLRRMYNSPFVGTLAD